MPSPNLPIEIILMVLEALSSPTPVAYPPSHTVTKTLCAFSLVSRAIQPAAIRQLVSRCLYIDSPARLSSLLHALGTVTGQPNWAPYRNLIPHMTSLYLAPFPDDLNNLSIISSSSILLYDLAPYLRRLVIDMPLRSMYPDQDTLVLRPRLRHAFSRLTLLEEFVSVRDELFLDLHDPEDQVREDQMWAGWPRLERLALYNPAVGWNEFWSTACRMPRLSTLVLTRADGLWDGNDRGDWRRAQELLVAAPVREVRVVLVNVPLDTGAYPRGHDTGMYLRARAAGVEGRVGITLEEVDVAREEVPRDPIVGCQEWVRVRAMEGRLWSETGRVLASF